MAKNRLDLLLVERGLAESRERAKSLILAGCVFCGGERVDKAGTLVDITLDIEVKGKDHPYVSRGGVKLAKALDHFSVDVAGKKALDVGASTGGFTDCLLQRGAASVTALDVGQGQMDWRLRNDPRIRLVEKFNARDITRENTGGPYDIVVIDVSFISLELILPPVKEVAADGGIVIALVKPQFEAGREEVGRGGIVRDPKVHEEVVRKILSFGEGLGLKALGETESPISGAKGNREFFALFEK